MGNGGTVGRRTYRVQRIQGDVFRTLRPRNVRITRTLVFGPFCRTFVTIVNCPVTNVASSFDSKGYARRCRMCTRRMYAGRFFPNPADLFGPIVRVRRGTVTAVPSTGPETSNR